MNFANEAVFDKAYIRDDRLERLNSMLERNNVEVVSSKWIGIKAKCKFRCMTYGHEWDAQGTAFFNTRRTAGCARSRAGQSRLMGSGSLDSFAKSFGGEHLPKKYFGWKRKYELRRKAGHVFRRPR